MLKKTLKKPTLIFPDYLYTISYNGRIIPNGQQHDIIKTGANCQVFAFHLLRLNDFSVPDYRSSELWSDTEFSTIVEGDFLPLDLLFFNSTNNPFGAHIAIYLGDNQVVHLSKSIGLPVFWSIEDFFKIDKYQVLIGGKRFFRQ